jgi:hypothetical protein
MNVGSSHELASALLTAFACGSTVYHFQRGCVKCRGTSVHPVPIGEAVCSHATGWYRAGGLAHRLGERHSVRVRHSHWAACASAPQGRTGRYAGVLVGRRNKVPSRGLWRRDRLLRQGRRSGSLGFAQDRTALHSAPGELGRAWQPGNRPDLPAGFRGPIGSRRGLALS